MAEERARSYTVEITLVRGEGTCAAGQKIAERVTYYDLASCPYYYQEFLAAKFLPHTDLSRFPLENISMRFRHFPPRRDLFAYRNGFQYLGFAQ